jgi:surface antigen
VKLMRRVPILSLGFAIALSGCVPLARLSNVPSYEGLSDNAVVASARARQQALETLPDGESLSWDAEWTTYTGTIKPYRSYVSTGGMFCRQFVEELQVRKKKTAYRNEACRAEDGYWVWL